MESTTTTTEDLNQTQSTAEEDQSGSGGKSNFNSNVPLSNIRDLTVYYADDFDRKAIPFHDIISRSERTVVSFLRRFGCPVCRAVSTGISYMKDNVFDPLGVKLVAIAIEDVGYDEFKRKGFFKGDIFINDGGSLFQAMGLKTLGVHNMFGVMALTKMKAAVLLASAEHYNDTRDFKGNGLQLGGFFIFSDYGKEITYQFMEDYAGDTPKVGEVLSALSAPLEIVRHFPDPSRRILDIAQEALKAMKKKQLLERHGHNRMKKKTVELRSGKDPDVQFAIPDSSRVDKVHNSNNINNSNNASSSKGNQKKGIGMAPNMKIGLPEQKLSLSEVYGHRVSPKLSPSPNSRKLSGYFDDPLLIQGVLNKKQRSPSQCSSRYSHYSDSEDLP